MALLGFAVAALFIGALVAGARWLVTRAFGVRGSFREMVNTGAERGDPLLAYARAFGSIAGMYLACVLLFIPAFAAGITVIDEVSMRVTVLPGGPAARAGLRDGDRVVGVNGTKVADWDALKRLVAAHPDETIHVDVDRGGEPTTFDVTTEGPRMKVFPFAAHESLSAGQILTASFAAPYRAVRDLVRSLFAARRSDVVGPVAVSEAIARANAESPAAGFFRGTGALASYQAAILSFVLLAVAFSMGFVAKRTLPTSGNSS